MHIKKEKGAEYWKKEWLNWIYMGHLGAYMGHKKVSDKQQNRDQEFLEKIQPSEKT